MMMKNYAVRRVWLTSAPTRPFLLHSKHSTKGILTEALSFEAWLIPRDVRTHWNAMYDMLDFAYQYKKAINKITDIREMKLRAYEIELHEWEIVKQLRDLLKVSNITFIPSDLMFFY